MKNYKYLLIVIAVVTVDQASKILVHQNMELHEEINVIGQWFRIHYLLNPGMAFGLQWENEFGKLALTFFRVSLMFGIIWYLIRSIKQKANQGFLICLALVLGGAIGNVTDSVFYGVIFNNAYPNSPTNLFHGQVIDMLYFPIFSLQWPSWIPLIGGRDFEFFNAVFNFADSCIFIGITYILIFQKRLLKKEPIESIKYKEGVGVIESFADNVDNDIKPESDIEPTPIDKPQSDYEPKPLDKPNNPLNL